MFVRYIVHLPTIHDPSRLAPLSQYPRKLREETQTHEYAFMSNNAPIIPTLTVLLDTAVRTSITPNLELNLDLMK